MLRNQTFRFGDIRRQINELVMKGIDERKAVQIVMNSYKNNKYGNRN